MRTRYRSAPWFLAIILGLGPAASADDPKPLRVVTPKEVGIIAIALNGRGDLLGFEWTEEEDRPGVLYQRPFLAKGKEMTYIPPLDGYTATLPHAVSDDGLVVGRAGKAAPFGVPVHLRNQAFVWDAEGGTRGLGALAGDSASFATGVSRDGLRIAGFSVGEDRMRACVWEKTADGWAGAPLPHESRLGSNVVALSPNGLYAAAVDGTAPCLWTLNDSGQWSREKFGESASMVPRAVNDAGTVVGLRHGDKGHDSAVVRERGKPIEELPKPPGYVNSEAMAINGEGVVVGLIDGPNGSPIGPNAFVYEQGKVRIIVEGGPWFTTATAINDDRQVAGVFEKDEDEPAPEKKPAP